MAEGSIRVRSECRGEVCILRVLIKHPMEPARTTESGERIPSHFIKELRFVWRGEPLLTVWWGPGISRNPYIEFSFEGARAGDEVMISWRDTRGETDATVVQIGT